MSIQCGSLFERVGSMVVGWKYASSLELSERNQCTFQHSSPALPSIFIMNKMFDIPIDQPVQGSSLQSRTVDYAQEELDVFRVKFCACFLLTKPKWKNRIYWIQFEESIRF